MVLETSMELLKVRRLFRFLNDLLIMPSVAVTEAVQASEEDDNALLSKRLTQTLGAYVEGKFKQWDVELKDVNQTFSKSIKRYSASVLSGSILCSYTLMPQTFLDYTAATNAIQTRPQQYQFPKIKPIHIQR